MELRPRMLKDCLLEDSNSCSSNGFKSFPRRPPLNPMIPKKKKQSNALQAVINAVKNLSSNAIKSTPSGILPRSLSRRLSSSKSKAEKKASISTIVRVKDIVRWSSSKDLLHENISRFQPHHQYTAAKTTMGSSSTTTSGTSSSSWCDSDFTSEFFLPSSSSWRGNVEKEQGGENYKLQCVGEDSCTAVTDADTVVGPEDLKCEEEQNSPVSVLEIQVGEDDETISDSSFSQCLDNVERTKQKLMQTIQRFENLANISPFDLDEWDEESCKEESCDAEIDDEEEYTDEVEEKAAELWDRVKEKHAIWIHEEHLIMDYFRDELMQRTTESHLQHFEEQLVGEAKGWLEGQRVSELECGTGEQRRLACAREIERLEWNEKQMKEELEEVATQIEDGLFSLLVNETLNALF